MNLDLELWVAMAAAALFYQYANVHKASTQLFLLSSVAVSVLVMLTVGPGYIGMLTGQALLFAALFLYLKLRK